MKLHWSVIPPAHCGPDSVVLEYRAAQYERHQAEREFMATERGTLEAWSTAAYMESAWQAEGAAYWAASGVYDAAI